MSSTIINNLPNIESYSYLELGLGSGINFNSIRCMNKTSVDITPNIATFTGTTDEYFRQLPIDVKFDIIFIDANHTCDFVLRDFNNSINHATTWILLHDMIPSIETDSFPEFCGDGYKILYHMLKYTNFEIYPMDNNHGFTLVKLPASKIELNEETKTLSYYGFKAFMAEQKVYNDDEIIRLLQNM